MPDMIYILNGPNLNLLGEREPDIYGTQTLKDIEASCVQHAEELGLEVRFLQSNLEGELVGWIQEAGKSAKALIINPAAYSHTSVALYDALKTLAIPAIEIHLSQPAARESFRRRSFVAPVVTGTISGLGENSYILAINAVNRLIN